MKVIFFRPGGDHLLVLYLYVPSDSFVRGCSSETPC